MTKPIHQEDPLSRLIKDHPIVYFVVMFLVGLAVGTICFDVLEYIDRSVVPTIKTPRYLAAVVFALGTHVGLSWRRRKRAG